MSDNGYEKFFKDAQKATRPSSPTKSVGSSNAAAKESRSRFSEKKKGGAAARAESPEDRLRAELAKRMRARRQQALRRKNKFPVPALICAIATLGVCGFAYFKADLAQSWANRLLSHVEFGVFANANAETEAKTTGPADAKAEKTAAAGDATKAANVPNTKQWTPEELSFFSKLNDRKKELDLREAELNKLDEELQKRQLELDQKLKQLEATRAEISETLKTRVASDQEKVDKLVQLYSSMKPQQAAKVMETENEDLAVEILDKMKKNAAAQILDMMDTKKARRLSELLTGYQRTPASAKDDDSSRDATTTDAPAGGENKQ